jgi:integrase
MFLQAQCDPIPIDVRVAWSKAVKAAGLDYFWIYDLRHTFASRITEAGASPIFVAQIMGHSSPNILQTYVKAIDEFRRSAILKLETLRSKNCRVIAIRRPKLLNDSVAIYSIGFKKLESPWHS